ncbi:serine/threonine-protein kinase DCLK2-like [Sorex fumeus]|uniref:serine/threonine-protein kinase DCLK2-like n=1 Tax=Sorex fumeus TaxID=62283 RepID=UPI0024AE4942|nr:serine/threonine-protein kinase DCLK2-like [Sorex fumeus]
MINTQSLWPKPLEEWDKRPQKESRRGASSTSGRGTTNFPRSSGRLDSTLVHNTHRRPLRKLNRRHLSSENKAPKVRFFCNGDGSFSGLVCSVSRSTFHSFDALLQELTHLLADQVSLPQGVRSIYTIDGSRKITCLGELEEGESYVCASDEPFCQIDYMQNLSPSWHVNIKIGTSRARGTTSSTKNEEKDSKYLLKPKLVTIVRSGVKSRKSVKILLKRKTSHCLEKVLTNLSQTIKPESRMVRKHRTLERKQVTSLQDIFGDIASIAYGSDEVPHLQDSSVSDYNQYLPLESSQTSSKPIKCSVSNSPGTSSGSKQHTLVNGAPSSHLETPKGTKSLASSPTKQDVSLEASQGFKKLSRPGMSSPNVKSRAERNHSSSRSHITGSDKSSALSTFHNKYKIGEVIGNGNFSVVKLCTNRYTGEEFALKIIDKTKYRKKEHLIMNEVTILCELKHPNIITLVENIEKEKEHLLVMELVKGGDLFDAITSSSKFSEEESSAMLQDLANALYYLHCLLIVHRDIKPENLLVFQHPNGTKSLKVGDFGLATVVSGFLYTICGTPTYLAPEIIAEKGYGLKVDIWATGVITYILLCGFPPFISKSNNQEELYSKILAGQVHFPTPHWNNISGAVKELIRQMLQVNVQSRYTAAQILRHPWVSDYASHKMHTHTKVTSKLK